MTDFSGGIATSSKTSKIPNSVRFASSVDHRTNPSRITINPTAKKEYVADALPMWGVRACTFDYSYCQNGDILRRDETWSKVATAANSVGNGMTYFPETGELIYAQNTTLGKLTDACTTTGQATDNFLGVQGGEPTNTKSIDLEASSSMYAARADTASLSITGDLTLEAYLKPESLPETDESMVLISKWDENSDERSYKMDLTTLTNFFGDGSDGALTISSNTTETVIDSACSGTAGTYSLSATNASFAAGQKIMIHQTRGTNNGVTQYTEIQSYTAGTITTVDTLDISFNSTGNNKAQVRVMKQYTNVTIASGKTYTAKAWNGTVGGILGFYANGTVTVTGTITAVGKGFLGGDGDKNITFNPGAYAYSGEGNLAASQNTAGRTDSAGNRCYGKESPFYNAGGSGGGHGTNGSKGTIGVGANDGRGEVGLTSGSANLTTMTFGGGGSAAARSTGPANSRDGGSGGGILCIFGATITITGTITANGAAGESATDAVQLEGWEAGGGGAGGSVLIKAQTTTLGTTLVTASGGAGGTGYNNFGNGGAGGVGRIHLDYSSSYTGTTSPALSVAIDNSLASADGYSLRLQISDDGSTIESYTMDITTDITIGEWTRWAISWEDTTSTAKFYKNGTLLGTKTGTMTSIYNSTSQFAVGCDFGAASAAQNFIDGLMDDVRVWNDVRTVSELVANNGLVLVGSEANLKAYYEFTSDVTDSQADGLNDLTAYNTPTYSDDVPFSGITSRNDQDQGNTNDTYSATYTLGTAIVETDANKIFFTPDYDPQQSIMLSIDTIGTGDWTVTIHDALDRVVASTTISNGELNTGYHEFVYDTIFRPIIGSQYHAHITSTVADGKVDVKVGETTLSDGTEVFAYFTTHYQFLISDEYHPQIAFAGAVYTGNERYVSKLEPGNLYEPHILTLSSGFRARCVTQWREYMVWGCWKGSDITASEEGLLVFWDGIGDKMNFSIPVAEGGVNCLRTYQDTIILQAGYQGTWLGYQGGGVVQRINHIPNITPKKSTESAPGSMASWRTYLCIGSDLSTDSEEIEKGVYTLGALDATYPFSLGFEYPTSLGRQTSSNVSIGMVYASGQNLYIGWKNSNTYGIDVVSVGNDCYEDGSIESLITDWGTIAKERQPLTLRADFEPLEDGQSIRVKYRIDRETTWRYGEWEDTVGATDTRLPIEITGKELEIGVDMKSTSGDSPAFLGWTVEVDALEGEINV